MFQEKRWKKKPAGTTEQNPEERQTQERNN